MKSIIDALVPMKGHSERVKNKNIREFAGKPLFYYVVNALLSSEYIAQVIIDTDSEQIKELVNSFFPEERIFLLDRPEELCGDFAPFFDLLEYDMGHSKADIFLQTHATNPLLSESTVSRACAFFLKNREKYDSLFAVNELHTRLYNNRGEAMNHDPDHLIRPAPEVEGHIFFGQLGQDRRILQHDSRRRARKALDHSHLTQEVALLQNGNLLFKGCPVIGIYADRPRLDDVHGEGKITLPEKNLPLGISYCLHFTFPLPSQPFAVRSLSTAAYFAILASSSSFF